MASRSRVEALVSVFVTVHPHELPGLLHAFTCFFFLLGAYFVVLPLRDEGAISLGLGSLPGLFMASLLLTLFAAPASTYIFSLPHLSKSKALMLIHRFFGASLVLFFMLYSGLSITSSHYFATDSLKWPSLQDAKEEINAPERKSIHRRGLEDLGWYYISLRIGLYLWVALMNLVTISATWARVIDLMNSESGSRLFGFVGAGATLGQLCGSLLAVAMARLGPFLLLFSALLMELAARFSVGIGRDEYHESQELSIRSETCDQSMESHSETAEKTPVYIKHKFSAMLEGLQLILASTYLLHVCCFLWLTAVVSSFFYFQKTSVVATAVANALDRRRMFAQVNSFTAVFILIGQLTLTGQILTTAGITTAICAAPVVALANMTAIAIWPTWIVVALSETLRKVLNYVLTRPGKEVLFTVVTRDEKYKAKVCIDVLVQRLGDAAAAGIYKILQGSPNKGPSTVALCALPVCFAWFGAAFTLGRRQARLANSHAISS